MFLDENLFVTMIFTELGPRRGTFWSLPHLMILRKNKPLSKNFQFVVFYDENNCVRVI